MDGSKRLWAEWLFDGERWRESVAIQVGLDGELISLQRERPSADAECYACVIPGLVNAHAHLDLPGLDSRPKGGFVDWIRAVIRERIALDTQACESLVLSHLKQLMETGCTCVADVDATGLSHGALSVLGFQGRAYRELIGFDLGPEASLELIAGRSLGDGDGLSPHAPYSVSSALFQAARDCGRPLMIHCSETVEELELLQSGRGPFRELLEDLGRWDERFEAPACSPVAWLDRLSCLGPDTLLIHVQELMSGDLEILKRTESPVVICPGSIHYFQRDPPRVSEMWEAGLTLALGTDSLASNEQLDLFAEMQGLHVMAPELDPLRILMMATAMGGRRWESRVLDVLRPRLVWMPCASGKPPRGGEVHSANGSALPDLSPMRDSFMEGMDARVNSGRVHLYDGAWAPAWGAVSGAGDPKGAFIVW